MTLCRKSETNGSRLTIPKANNIPVFLNMVSDQGKRESMIGYHFLDSRLLDRALTHRSFSAFNNERLEFLGDSVLGVIVSTILYRLYAESEEGELTRMRAQVVKKDTLAQIARRLQLGNYLKLGGSATKGGGANNDSILADALESLVGAVYLDAGLEQAQISVAEIFKEELSALDPGRTAKDPKTELQELLQSKGMLLPKYKVESILGSSHEPKFVVSCYVEDDQLLQCGTGPSRKSAEQAAAQKLLLILR